MDSKQLDTWKLRLNFNEIYFKNNRQVTTDVACSDISTPKFI